MGTPVSGLSDLEITDCLGLAWTLTACGFVLATPFVLTPAVVEQSAAHQVELSGMARLALQRWVQWAGGGTGLALLAWAMVADKPLAERRAVAIAAFLLVQLLAIFYLVALYEPLFRIADASSGAGG